MKNTFILVTDQQSRDTIALEELIREKLVDAIADGADLDLEVHLGATSLHLRVTEVQDGLVLGIWLGGFRFDGPREMRGETVLRIAGITMIEIIAATAMSPSDGSRS